MDLFSQTNLFSTTEIRKTEFDLQGAEVVLFESFFSIKESNILYNSLLENTIWEQDQMTIYGKKVNLPRLTAWYGNVDKTLFYAGSKRKMHSWNVDLALIKERIEQEVNIKFTRCLLNFYRNGNDSVDWHQDYRGAQRKNTVIGSVTFGTTRPFQLKHATQKDLKRVDIPLTHGSLLVMQGATQENWKHKIPKTTKKIPPRINLTFRWVKKN
ncbi:alpha-ketoglutarate-dependent dioxygenase AlkB family protein [Tenacibaculum retecalamus]|uniref:alpha-ketoglutarate-dependent dioxygenase AlkB family protein n=1 Tax=Tenacibaculum retecalamus TaxID=3018315 RepID=UPI0023D910B6|nr:alpha-ketoglutarate-dependent dioxygenase AlkB [Tenacibaculum retecalamus]WBX70027.1 alpha-ketoglutarate-dependent dioxygenase AlkB [Tenacibaculum retecalamus]